MTLSAFFKTSALPLPVLEKVVSKRFVDEAGNPIPWKFKGVPEDVNAGLKAQCTKMVTEKGGKQRMHFDANLYNAQLTAESVTFPDLRNAELQASYGVLGADKLLQVMLSAGEFARASEAAQEVSDFDLEEAIEEAKNSSTKETAKAGTATS
jgi:hypothetical protein